MGGSKKGLTIALVLFVIALLADLYTTLQLGDLVQYLESNPIYSHVGLTGIVLFNILILVIIYFSYTRSKSFRNRFMILNMVITLTVVRIMVAYNNFLISKNPPTLELARQVTIEMKRQVVSRAVGLSLLPFIIAIVTFYIYVIDHNTRIKREKYE